MIEDDDIESDDPNEALHARALKEFRLCQDRETDNRKEYEDDIRFARLGEQWDATYLKHRREAGRPCLTINKLPPFIRQVVNDARQNKPQIKVLPQDSAADPKTAEIISGLIRNIETSSDADVAYDTALDCAASGGFGYFRLNLTYAEDTENPFAQDIVFQSVSNPLTIYGDPYSDCSDSSDWTMAFVTEMVPRKRFEAEYGEIDAEDWDANWEHGWREGDQVMVAEYWVRKEIRTVFTLLSDGQIVEDYDDRLGEYEALGLTEMNRREKSEWEVTQHILSGRGVLKSTPWPGKYIPIVPVYGEEININGERRFRSLIRDAKDAQVMYNAWRSAAAETVALAPKSPFIGPVGAFETDRVKWETANTENYAYIEYDPVGGAAPQRQGPPSVNAAALQEALNASDDMKGITGIYDAGMGARSNETSGRAIIARQRESDTSTFHFIDNLSRAIRHGGRILIDLIPKIYNTQRIIRILGENPQDVQNVQIGSEQDAQAQQAQQAANPMAQYDPLYVLGLGRYDLTVSSGPSFTTRREEAASQMLELARAFPQAAPLIADLLAQNLDWPGADEIAARFQQLYQQQQQASQPQQPQGPTPEQQAQQAQAQQDGQIKMMELQTRQAEAQAKATVEAEKLQIDRFKAETDRMKVQADLMRPARLPAIPNPQAGMLQG